MIAGARPLVLARAYSAAVTLLIPLVLARLLTVSEYGTFKQFFLISSTFYLVLGLGVPQSLYYFLPRAAERERRALLGQTLLFLQIAGVTGAGILFAGRSFLSALGGGELVEAAAPMALFSWLLLGGGALETGLTAQGKPRAAAIAYCVSDSFRAAAFLVPAVGGLGLEGILWGAGAYAAARSLASWWILVRRSEGPLFDAPSFRRQIAYSLPYGGAMLVAMPQQQLHQYAVAFTSSPAAFAIYSVGCFNLPVVDLLYTPTSELLMYRIGELEREGRPASEAAAAFREAVGKLALFFVPVALGIFSIAPSFLTLLYGAPYGEAAPILRISVVTVLLATLPVDGVLRAKARTRLLLFSYLGKIAISVPLVFGFLRALGPIGAMVGFACTEIAHKGWLLLCASRVLAGGSLLPSLRDVLPVGDLSRAAAAAGVAAAAIFVFRRIVPAEPLASVLLHGGAFWVLYAGGLVVGGMRVGDLVGILGGRKH